MATVTKSSVAPTASAPVDLLDTDVARLLTHLHPIVLLGTYYFGFSALVADPVGILLKSLLPLAVIQIAYVAVCLPAAGTANGSPVKKSGQRKKQTGKGNVASSIVPALLSTLISVLLGPPALMVVMILFGAPLTTHFQHTLLAATHIAFLSVLPLTYVYGVDGQRWKEVISATLPLDEVFGATVGCLTGAWLGAVPIPLDWDREWQKWPVTIVTGAYCGYALGKLVGGYAVKGKRMDFE